jgi:hypothetical protein
VQSTAKLHLTIVVEIVLIKKKNQMGLQEKIGLGFAQFKLLGGGNNMKANNSNLREDIISGTPRFIGSFEGTSKPIGSLSWEC